jgi:Uma2 family endonuclease
MVAQRDDWMSVEDFLALDRESLDQNYEYMNGHMYALAGGSGNHALIISNTHAAIHHHLKSSSYAILIGMTIKIDDVCLLPDIIVTDNEQDIEENKTYMKSPKLVIEVLSPSTEKKDRGEKFLHYINCSSIQEYVLISQDSMLVQVYTRKDLEWGYRGYTRGEKVELKSIGLIFPIEELYERVILPPSQSLLRRS